MATLTRASKELFTRPADERFPTFLSLQGHCQREKANSQTLWCEPCHMTAVAGDTRLQLETGDARRELNHWSFSQLCRLANVDKRTLEQLSPQVAADVFRETLPATGKPFQVYSDGPNVRSLHGVSYTRLFNADVLDVVAEWATNFRPPQVGMNGGTGLYCGEEDMFCFLIDPAGWVEIGDQAYAPGFFVWNSEVGRRTVGIQAFWFQSVCENHIVWDCAQVTEFERKHTSKVTEALENLREVIADLVTQRDLRRDSFVDVMKSAINTKLGADKDEAVRKLGAHGFTKALAEQAVELAADSGRLTLYSVVDALTRLSQHTTWAGTRTDSDIRAGRLLDLAVA